MITKGITLDLNGKTLTAGHVVVFAGNHIVDNSTAKTGLLKVEKSNLVLAKDNAQMPIWNGADGYVFATLTLDGYYKTKSVTADTFEGAFRPSFKKVHNAFFADGAADNDVQFIIRMSWTNTDGKAATQELVYTDDLIQDVYGMNKQFTIAVSGFEGFTNFKIECVVESVTGVQAAATFDMTASN